MAKTQEELKVIKEEVETLNNKLKELTEEELAQVSGGVASNDDPSVSPIVPPANKPLSPTALRST